MCDCYEPPKVNPDGTLAAPKPIPTNTRFACAEVRGGCVSLVARRAAGAACACAGVLR